MSQVHLTLPTPHAAQQRAIREARRFNALDCGRRFGKTQLGENRLLCEGGALDGAPVAWFSPTYRMLSEVWREVVSTTTPIVARRLEDEHRLELKTRGVIDMWSLDAPNRVRGRKYRRVIIDEAAMIPDLQAVWEMVIRPTLVDYRGDAWFLSTPKGYNFFKVLFDRGQDSAYADYASWKFSSYANPHIPASELDAMRQELPERVYQQEIIAEFLDDAGGVFRQVMRAATATTRQVRDESHRYVIGVDWGKSNDFTVLTVLDGTDRRVVEMDRFNQIDYSVQLGRLQALVERWQPDAVVPEANSMGGPLIEQLRRMGIRIFPYSGFTTTNASKGMIIDALALAFEQGAITILNDPVLVSELQAYEMERMPGGAFRYSAPSGMHDDCVMSLALAWYGAGSTGVETLPSLY